MTNIAVVLGILLSIESGGNDNAVGDGGKAVGAYQIWPIYVAEANRIVGEERWTLDDRWDRTKSEEMVSTVLAYWGQVYAEETGVEPTVAVYCMIHHRPNGNAWKVWKWTDSDRAYAKKVRERLTRT